MYSCYDLHHQGWPILCTNGHGWLPSCLLYRNCKSVCVMEKRPGSIYLFTCTMDTVPTPACTGTGQSVLPCLHKSTSMYAQFVFIIFFAYNESDRYVLLRICITYSSKWETGSGAFTHMMPCAYILQHAFVIPKLLTSFAPHHASSPANFSTLTPWSDPYCVPS